MNRSTNQGPSWADCAAVAQFVQYTNQMSASLLVSLPRCWNELESPVVWRRWPNRQGAPTDKCRRIRPGVCSRPCCAKRNYYGFWPPAIRRLGLAFRGVWLSFLFREYTGYSRTSLLTEDEAYPQCRPAAAAGSANQRVNKNNLFLPFSCSGDNSTAHTGYSDCLEYSCSDDNDVWSSVDGQYTDQTPQSVINRANNVTRCHIQNKLSWHALFSVMNFRRTISTLVQCHVYQR